jgi:hypothetical protein
LNDNHPALHDFHQDLGVDHASLDDWHSGFEAEDAEVNDFCQALGNRDSGFGD